MKAKKKRISKSRLLRFPEVKGKVVELVEIDEDATAITILFSDRTELSFDFESQIVVFPELSDFKTGNWRGIKRWPSLRGRLSMVKWP